MEAYQRCLIDPVLSLLSLLPLYITLNDHHAWEQAQYSSSLCQIKLCPMASQCSSTTALSFYLLAKYRRRLPDLKVSTQVLSLSRDPISPVSCFSHRWSWALRRLNCSTRARGSSNQVVRKPGDGTSAHPCLTSLGAHGLASRACDCRTRALCP